MGNFKNLSEYVRMVLEDNLYSPAFKKKIFDLFFDYLAKDDLNNEDLINNLIGTLENLAAIYGVKVITNFVLFLPSRDIDSLGQVFLNRLSAYDDEEFLVSFVNLATNLDYAKFEEHVLDTNSYGKIAALGRRIKKSNPNVIGNKLMQLYNNPELSSTLVSPTYEKDFKGNILQELIWIKEVRCDEFKMGFEQLESMVKLQGDTYRAALLLQAEMKNGADSSNMVDYILSSNDYDTIYCLFNVKGVDNKRVWEALDRIDEERKVFGQLKRED